MSPCSNNHAVNYALILTSRGKGSNSQAFYGIGLEHLQNRDSNAMFVPNFSATVKKDSRNSFVTEIGIDSP
jgi:hypothetical protein